MGFSQELCTFRICAVTDAFCHGLRNSADSNQLRRGTFEAPLLIQAEPWFLTPQYLGRAPRRDQPRPSHNQTVPVFYEFALVNLQDRTTPPPR
jgi:hypothetical protein